MTYFRFPFTGGKAATSSGSAVRMRSAASRWPEYCAPRSDLGRFGSRGWTISSSATTVASALTNASPSSLGRLLIHAWAIILKPAQTALGGYRTGSALVSNIYAPQPQTFPEHQAGPWAVSGFRATVAGTYVSGSPLRRVAVGGV